RRPRRANSARRPRHRPAHPARAQERRMSEHAVAAPTFRVERWTWVSVAFTGGLTGLVALLAFAPVVLSENSQNNLIQLYFLVTLAVMWNALAGYGGLVSVGQQGFIGIGAYGAVFFS